MCLSQAFLQSQSKDTGMVPRGGICMHCHTYTLWGDVIRGCYRRMAGGAICEPEDEDCGEEFASDVDQDRVVSNLELPKKLAAYKGKRKAHVAETSVGIKKPRRKPVAGAAHSTSEGEGFDLDVSSADEGHIPPLRRVGRPRRVPQTPVVGTSGTFHSRLPVKRSKDTGGEDRPKDVKRMYNSDVGQGHIASDESGEHFDFGAISNSEDDTGLAPIRLVGNEHPGKAPGAFPDLRGPPAADGTGMGGSFQGDRRPHNGGGPDDDLLSCANEHTLSRAMSTLSVSSAASSRKLVPKFQGLAQRDAIDVIELSD